MNKEEVKVALLSQSLFLYVHLYHSALPKIDKVRQNLVDFTYYLFTLHYSLKRLVDFWKVISNSEKGRGMVQTRKSELD